MSGVMGSTVVNLGLNNDRFKKGLASSQSGLKQFAGSAKTLLLGAGAGAIAAGAAVWGLSDRVGKLAGVADKAAQTGLSGKFLQQLEYAADQSGVSAETLTGAIKKLVVLTGKAAGESKEAADALASFGLSAKDLANLSPEQQFLKIAAKLGEIKNPAERAAAAVKVFGKSGIEMTTLFAGGLDDINKLMKDAADLGIGLDDKALAKAAEADDAIQRMKASFSALLDQVAVGVAPAFSEIANYITGWIPPLTKFLDGFNALPDKADWAGRAIVAAFDLAFAHIENNWSDMVNGMFDKVASVNWTSLLNPFAGIKIEDLRPKGAPQNLDQAKANFAGAMKEIEAARENNNIPFEGPKLPKDDGGEKLRNLAKDLWNKVTPFAESAVARAEGFIDDAKGKAESAWGTLSGMFTGPAAEKQKQIEPQLAGAMQRGSSEAFSTIVQSIIGNKADPVVKAIKEQTKELAKQLKPPKLQPLVAMGPVMG